MVIYKIRNFENMLFFEIEKFQKFDDFLNCEIWEIYGIFQIGNLWNFPNGKLIEFSKSEILKIFQIETF